MEARIRGRTWTGQRQARDLRLGDVRLGQQRLQHHRRHGVPGPVCGQPGPRGGRASRNGDGVRSSASPSRRTPSCPTASRSRWACRCCSCPSWAPSPTTRTCASRLMQLFATLGALATLAMFFVAGRPVVAGRRAVHHRQPGLRRGHRLLQRLPARHRQRGPARPRLLLSAGPWATWAAACCCSATWSSFSCASTPRACATGLAVRINLASAGVWWLGWSFLTWARLRPRHAAAASAGRRELSHHRFQATAPDLPRGAPVSAHPALPAGLPALQRRHPDRDRRGRRSSPPRRCSRAGWRSTRAR